MSDEATGSGARRAAAAITRHAKQVHSQIGRDVELAKIRSVSTTGVLAEMYGGSATIEEGQDLSLTQFVRWWDTNYALLPGDTLLCVELEDHSWLGFDVWTNRTTFAGVRPSRSKTARGQDMRAAQASGPASALFTMGSVPSGGGTPSVTWNFPLVKKLEVFDKDGALIGFVPVFTTLP